MLASSYRALFVADAATTALYGLIVLAAPSGSKRGRRPDARPDGAPGAARAVLGDPVLLAVCGLAFAFSIVFFQSFVALPIHVRAHGLSPVRFGVLIAINGLLIVFLQPLAGELTRYRSRRLTLAAASLLLGAGLGMNAWVGSFGGYAVSVTIWTLGEILSRRRLALCSSPIWRRLHLRGTYRGGLCARVHGRLRQRPCTGWIHPRTRRRNMAVVRLPSYAGGSPHRAPLPLTVERNASTVPFVCRKESVWRPNEGDLLQGTLDMLVLKALQLEPMHGWGITERIEQWSEQVLQLGQGTLYPALYRLERQGLIRRSGRRPRTTAAPATTR